MPSELDADFCCSYPCLQNLEPKRISAVLFGSSRKVDFSMSMQRASCCCFSSSSKGFNKCSVRSLRGIMVMSIDEAI